MPDVPNWVNIALLVTVVLMGVVILVQNQQLLRRKGETLQVNREQLAAAKAYLGIAEAWARSGYAQHAAVADTLGQVRAATDEVKQVVATVAEQAGNSGVIRREPKADDGTVSLG